MRNYVKEMELVIRKRDLSNIFPAIWSLAYFIGYSVLIFMHNQKYYEIFLAFSIPLTLAIPCLALGRTILSDNERAVRNEIMEARKFLEKSSGKADNEGINALVDLYRSQKGDKKWESIEDMLCEAFTDKGELRKAVSGIMEK
jgi:hypothetical protein